MKKASANNDIVFGPTQRKTLFRNVPSWADKTLLSPKSKDRQTKDTRLHGTPGETSSGLSSSSSRVATPTHPTNAKIRSLNRLRRSPPSKDKFASDSSDDELKILENFKIADDSAKQDRLRPPITSSHLPPRPKKPAAAAVITSTQGSRPRSQISVNVPYRPSPRAPSPTSTIVPSQKSTQPIWKRPSDRLPPREVNSPSYQFVASPTQSAGFSLVVPLSQDGVGGSQNNRTPVPYRVDEKKEKQLLLAELKESIEPVETRLAEVEKHFGQTGFSAAFATDDNEIRLRNGASKKKRKVKKKHIKLDWGETPLPNQQAEADLGRTALVHPTQQVQQLLTDRFQEHHDPPLTFANDVNDRRLNGKFQFVNRYIFCQGVRTANPNTNYGCNCAGSCNPISCTCVLDRAGERSTMQQPIVPYTRRPDGLVVLSDEYMLNELTPSAHHFEISECNDNCDCGPDCPNRVVGRGRTVPLEVFQTEKCGFGVRSSVNIVKGQFLDLYLGEVITYQELERRENAKEENASSYIYSLDWFGQQYCYHVDGENFGTAMRFVNHNCSPNARNFTVQTHKGDKHVYYLAFFAIKDIPAGTEICIDYSPQEDGKYIESERASSVDTVEDEEEEGRARCYCGADNCRKFLWRSAGRKRKKRKTTKHD